MKISILIGGIIILSLPATVKALVAEAESCDVLNAVTCFSTMPAVPKPHMMTDVPDAEIVEPCREQVQKNTELRNCLTRYLEGCPSVKEDAFKLIDMAESFCRKVEACGDFTAQYKAGLTCTSQMFQNIIGGGGEKLQYCQNFSNCLVTKAKTCPALTSFLHDHWKMFESTCNVAKVVTPPELMNATEAQVNLVCSDLETVTMGIYICDQKFKATVGEKDKIDVRPYCTAVADFESCVETALSKCTQFYEVFKSSIANYFVALEGVCGTNRTAINKICDTTKLKECYSNIGISVWKVESYIIEGVIINSSSGIEQFINHAKQLTDASRDFKTMCKDVTEQIGSTEQCIQNQVEGCPIPLQRTMDMNAGYLRAFCGQIGVCSNNTFTALQTCSDTATNNIDNLLKTTALPVANIAGFTKSFCDIFKALVTCMHGQFTQCGANSDEVYALYEMLVDDLYPICSKIEFVELQNRNMSARMMDFVDCRYMPVISYDLGTCTDQYLYDLTKNPTDSTAICTALNNWDNCTKITTEDCSILATHVRDIVEGVRTKLEAMCPRPTTLPPPDNGEPTAPGGNNTDADGGARGLHYVHPAGLIAVFTVLLSLLLS